MSNFSLDDILNEYPKVKGDGESSKVSVDDILGEYSVKKAKSAEPEPKDDAFVPEDTAAFSEPERKQLPDSDEILRTVYVPSADNNEPKNKDIQKPAPDKRKKELAAVASAPVITKDRPRKFDFASEEFRPPVEEALPPKPAAVKPSRSFSEKFELGDIYNDGVTSEDIYKKAGLMEKLSGRAKQIPFIAKKRASEESAETEGGDIFISSEGYDGEAAGPFGGTSEKSLEDILNEYSKEPERHERVHLENTYMKGITDFMGKLLAPDGGGNSELIDGMKKAKRERLSRTSPDLRPIERKTISDIDLKLDDKIIPNTAKIHYEQSEIEKMAALRERRKKKIKDFVLIGDEEETAPEALDIEDEEKTIDDFESFEDAPSILGDISQLKGSLLMRLIVLMVCFLFSFYMAAANDSDMIPLARLLDKRSETAVFIFVNSIIGILAAFASSTVISCGLSKLMSLKADCDSLCAVSVISSIAVSIIALADDNMLRGGMIHIYIPVAIASLLFNTVGKLLIIGRALRGFRFVSGASEKYAIFSVADEDLAQGFTRGALSDFPRLASMKKTEFFTDFLKISYASDSADRFSRIAAPLSIAAALIAGTAAALTAASDYGSSAVYIGISVFSGVVAACAGFSIMLIVNLPVSRAAKRLSENQGYMLGFDSIEQFAGTNSALIDASALFPAGSVKLAGIKVFSDTRIDEAIVEAASLTTQSESILKNMFYDIIGGKTELLNTVESYVYEDSMGLGGWINNKRVLLGNRELMTNHSIEGMPSVEKEQEYSAGGKNAVYLSISGELSAMFIVDLAPSVEVASALKRLQKNDVYIMLRTVDSVVTTGRLSELFDISPEFFKIIPFRAHRAFGETTAYSMREKAFLACSGKFSSFTSLILCCRRLKSAVSAGIGIQAVSMALGFVLFLILGVTGSYRSMSVSMVFAYNMIFTFLLAAFHLLRKY